jgi:hypothetical protein
MFAIIFIIKSQDFMKQEVILGIVKTGSVRKGERGRGFELVVFGGLNTRQHWIFGSFV